MRDIAILCTDSVVRQILSGAKTQDRRPLKPRPELRGSPWAWYWRGGPALERAGYGATYVHTSAPAMMEAVLAVSPRVGDRLWVRECWAPTGSDSVCWRADCPIDEGVQRSGFDPRKHPAHRWRPSIHMPRWACRIVLPIARVWVERIREISEEDARAEGARPEDIAEWRLFDRRPGARPAAVQSFRACVWDQLYPGSWERNDWVLCVAWDKPEVAR